MAASRFVDVSEEEIDIMKENSIPKNTKDATKFGVTLFRGKTVPALKILNDNFVGNVTISNRAIAKIQTNHNKLNFTKSTLFDRMVSTTNPV